MALQPAWTLQQDAALHLYLLRSSLPILPAEPDLLGAAVSVAFGLPGVNRRHWILWRKQNCLATPLHPPYQSPGYSQG